MSFIFYTNKNVHDILDVDVEALPYTYLKSYQKFVKQNYNANIVIALENEQKIFVALNTYTTKFVTNAQLLSEPFTVNGELPVNQQKSFYEKLIIAIQKNKIADRIITPQNFVVLGDYPKNSYSCRFGSYQINLTKSEEQLFSTIHPKHRNKINKAQRAGVEIKSGLEQLKIFYKLYAETMKRSNMYCEPFSFFESFYNNLTEKNCLCSVVYHNNIPQGALLAPYTKYCCYYVYGASASNMSESGSVNFLHWQTMLLMKSKQVKLYDFVGARLSDVSNTKLEGIQSFKERFGSELKKGFLFKTDINKTKVKLFDIAVTLSNKLRGRKMFKDIIDQENEKEKHSSHF